MYQNRDNTDIVTRHVRLPEPSGVRLLLVSDLHARNDWFPRPNVRALVDRVNEVPDIDTVLLLGDYVGHDVTAIEWAADELARITAPMIGVLGNHDHWTDPERVAQALEHRAGVQMLTNTSIHYRDDLWLAGIDSCWGGAPDARLALKHVPAGARTIVLGHEPWLATLHDRYVHLAGHTHHGQVRPPLLGEWASRPFYPRFSDPFPRGLYRRDDSFVYTTAGVGYSTVSWRLNCPPEIVVFEP